MFGNSSRSPVARRSFLSRIGAGMTMFGATLAAGESAAGAQSPGNGSWQPGRHAQDDWLDQVPGRHRFVFDTTSPAGFGAALLYANNFFLANQSGYGLGNADAAVVIVARHNSTQFAYTDAIWAKYGAPIARGAEFEDPKTRQPPADQRLQRSRLTARCCRAGARRWTPSPSEACTSRSARWPRAALPE